MKLNIVIVINYFSVSYFSITMFKILDTKITSDLVVILSNFSAKPFLNFQEVYAITTGTATRTAKKAIGLISKTTALHVHHAFLYISLPSLHDYNVKLPNFTFCRGREQKTTTFFFFS